LLQQILPEEMVLAGEVLEGVSIWRQLPFLARPSFLLQAELEGM
jgi:hypothetical protein